ncbi:MAG: S41 family peptidase [Candidatus Sulfotelmatobacter sp.]
MTWKSFCLPASLAIVCALVPVAGWSQQYAKSDRRLAEAMLLDADTDVQKHYYDSKFHGIDWKARVQEAKKNVATARSMDDAVSEIAALLDSLHDSHTSLVLPPRTQVHDYGFQMEMIGDRCYVVRVRAGGDAEKKGLRPGDEVRAVNGYPVSRENFRRLVYIVNVLRPQPELRLSLADAAGGQRQLEVMARFQASTVNRYFLHQGINVLVRDADARRQILRPRYFEKGEDLLVIKIPEFAFSASEVDTIVGKMRAHTGVVLDLRGNPGGYADTLDRVLGGLFQNDLKIFDRVGRTATKPVSATGRHHDAFTGRFAVLIDSESASASEVLARVVQIEKRGFIVGDRSSGSVMEARLYPHEVALDSIVSYAISVTDADLVMTDGKSLEHVGVEPDILILPTGEDLVNNRDPALAKAAGLVGAKLSPEEAGKILPHVESDQFQTALSLND